MPAHRGPLKCPKLRLFRTKTLTLYVAFWLQLENGYIAAFTVGILSLQTRGQAYQKALYQLLMTVVGVVASIVIAGLLAQARDLFVIAYAIWLGLCVYVGGGPRRTPATRRVQICANCGAEFMSGRSSAKWCSRSCQGTRGFRGNVRVSPAI